MKPVVVSFALLMLVIWCGSAEGGPITVVLLPERDAEIRFQADVFLQVAETQELSAIQGFNVVPGPLSEQRAALEFNLSTIPNSTLILSGTLSLTDRNAGLGLISSSNIEVHGYVGDGVITLADAGVTNLDRRPVFQSNQFPLNA